MKTDTGRKLGFWPQVALIFFTVSGGAYGLEALVGAVGPRWSVIMVIALPIFWAIPISLMVAELSSAIPEDGGYYVWVRRGLGKFWGAQEGWWTLCYSAVDMALYPVLFVNYLSYFFPWLTSENPAAAPLKWVISVCFIVVSLLFNLRGSRAVGMGAFASLLLVTFPFALLTIYGGFHGSWAQLGVALSSSTRFPAPTPSQLATGLAVVLWNFCGWDNISTYGGDVENPSRNVPRALGVALIIITLSYLLPLLAGFKATLAPADWSESAGWPVIAAKLGGNWLGIFGAAAALISAWAMFNSQLLYVTKIPLVMARDQLLPACLAKVSPRTGAPVVALIVVASVAALFSVLSLSKLIVVDILFYTLGLSLEFAALIALRKKEPGLARPFRIPLERGGLILLASSPLLLAGAVAVFSMLGEEGSLLQVGIVIGASLIGVALYRYAEWRKVRAVSIAEPIRVVG